MVLDSRSALFKASLLIIWAFPYLALALRTRDWLNWTWMLFQSATSVALFSTAVILLGMLLSDFHQLSFVSIERVLQHSLFVICFLFPGLPLIITMGVLTILLKPSFEGALVMGAITTLFHLLYLTNVANHSWFAGGCSL